MSTHLILLVQGDIILAITEISVVQALLLLMLLVLLL